jgi:hypothetical protein
MPKPQEKKHVAKDLMVKLPDYSIFPNKAAARRSSTLVKQHRYGKMNRFQQA